MIGRSTAALSFVHHGELEGQRQMCGVAVVARFLRKGFLNMSQLEGYDKYMLHGDLISLGTEDDEWQKLMKLGTASDLIVRSEQA